jgi:hypothetical protein
MKRSPDFADLIREGYSQNSFYGDEGEWTKDNRMEARVGCFWRLDRLCIPRNSELRLNVITHLHESSSAGHRGAASTLAEALDRFWWKRIRQDVKDFCERCVVCRRAKIQPQMAATLYPLHVPPRPWIIIGLDYLPQLLVSHGLDSVLIVVDHLTRMAHFMPCRETVIAEEAANSFLHGVYRLHGLPLVLISDRDLKIRQWLLADTLATPPNASDYVFQSTPRDKRTDGARQHHISAASSLLLLLRRY